MAGKVDRHQDSSAESKITTLSLVGNSWLPPDYSHCLRKWLYREWHKHKGSEDSAPRWECPLTRSMPKASITAVRTWREHTWPPLTSTRILMMSISPSWRRGLNSKQLRQKDVYYRLNKYKKLYVFYVHRQGSTVGKTYSSRATKSSAKYVYILECCKVRVWLRQARTLHLARSPRTQEKYWIWHQVFLGNLVSNSVWGNFFLPKLPYI